MSTWLGVRGENEDVTVPWRYREVVIFLDLIIRKHAS